MTGDDRPPVPWLAVGLISAAALGYELLLTRLFSIAHWHHLVGMIISLALLGYGASGTVLTLLGGRVRRHFAGLFVANALLFVVSAGLAVWLIRLVPLNPLELPWEPRQPLYLMAIYAAAAVPFLGAANCIGMTLAAFAPRSHQVYAVDLAGAALGVAAVTALLWLVHPRDLLWLACLTGLAAALAGGHRLGVGPRTLLPALGAGAVAMAAVLGPLELEPAPYKALHQATAAKGARVELESPGPMGVVTVVANDDIPFRQAPGLSLLHRGPPSPQRGVFVDGEGAGALTPLENGEPPDFLDHLLSALPYHLTDRPRVLILGLRGNGDMLQALGQGARRIRVVEPNAELARLLSGPYAELTGHPYRRPDTRLVVADPRTHAQRATQTFDLVFTDLGNAGNVGGLRSQSTSFRFTTEAFTAYLRHLSPGGLVAVSGQLQRPPRESLKLVATARDALRRAGVSRPASHLAMIRDWQRFTLVIARRPLSAEHRQAVRRFAASHGFDLVTLPGLERAAANRHHRLESPQYFDAVNRLLGGDAETFTRGYPFVIAPATDDSPFFFRFSRWHNLPELLDLPAGTGFAQLGWAYWMTVAALVQALVLALLLILLPLLALGRSRAGAGLKARTAAYFGCVGVAFLFVEIAFIQRFQLVLGHPVYAFAAVLTGFLVWAGLGSLVSRRGITAEPPVLRRRLLLATAVIALTAVAYLALLPAILDTLLGWSFAARLAATLALIAPLGIAMGMPFPLGLALVEGRASDLLPWAWGINGSASVVSSIAAVLVAMEVGFSGLVVIAVGLYLALPWILAGPRHH